ncbi:putative peptide modification system cyclase [Lysobacter sp. GX 14042]|uniref:putative peptide modification system cyclase n=1 Tax=Lysobacter sp. GX 14042 TaxID=2907155 RepID=UPI001F48B99A|nr:putative peptide modification system cyclase [Lysobacter sp. GX 14042]MCE7032240.1 putative peptide modification system cyclase [Lysobacter sp. GX 14042]
MGVIDQTANTEATPPPAAVRTPPQLRTILLTDLVDSTELVEKLGDGAAAELFRAHDRLVLQLQQRWHGRLIDRSDGMLLLFERPIDGLGFALDYARGLREVGAPHQAELKSRTGLHVGEVLTWRNSEEAVRVGAKPLEVEGLAKPMAARLMGLARPGQILLSAVAEPLAHRAARELGERGQHLAWKSWGRWRFKGVPEAQEVIEVGEPGIAPLRMPIRGPKAWRDLPLWRRPAALVAQVALLSVVVGAMWFLGRPQPAIAFSERDWVVLADVRNLTGEPLLDDSLALAFRVSLEQSRHVNVLGDMKVRDTIARMQLQPGAALDRATASEVALRSGARAVILPTVADVSGRLRVSAEVIEPGTQTTVYTEFADARSPGAALDSIDQVTTSLRARLGEAVANIERDHAPLPEVSTSSLDALKAYAQGKEAFAKGEWRDAIALYEAALAIDREFALAHLAISQVHVALSDRPSALPHLDAALARRDRMPPRERLYLDAWEAEMVDPGLALLRWKTLASMYPDYHAGQANAGWHLFQLNAFDDALPYVEASGAPAAPLQFFAHDRVGRIHLVKGRIRDAQERFHAAEAMQPGTSSRRLAWTQAVLGQHAAAYQVIDGIPASGHGVNDTIREIDRAAFAADTADWPTMRKAIERGLAVEELATQFALIEAGSLLVVSPEAFDAEYARSLVRRMADQLRTTRGQEVRDASMLMAAAWLAQRAGHTEPARLAMEELRPLRERLAGTVVDDIALLVEAGEQELIGRPDLAVQLLDAALDGTELVQTRVAMLSALRASGRLPEAEEHARWLAANRGRAFAEANASQVLQSLNVMDTRLALLDLAEIHAAADNSTGQALALNAFLAAWPRDRLPDHLERRIASIFPASK